MMNLAIVILINIGLGVIFYLIISLKLEKSASEFREKKLHEEMNKVIKEFNITAERNISLLENRIKILQNLLKQQEHIPSLDITVDDEKQEINKGFSPDYNHSIKDDGQNNILDNDFDYNIPVVPEPVRSRVSLVYRIKELISDILSLFSTSKNQSAVQNQLSPLNSKERLFQQSFKTPVFNERLEYNIEKEFDDNMHTVAQHEEESSEKSNDDLDDISSMIRDDMDIHEVINQLHARGLQVHEIARYVGKPEGEIKLVLNLNSSR